MFVSVASTLLFSAVFSGIHIAKADSVVGSFSIGDTSNVQIGAMAYNPANEDLYIGAGDRTGSCVLSMCGIYVIDGLTNRVVATIPLGSIPDGIAYDPGNHNIYASASSSTLQSVFVINSSTNNVITRIPLGEIRSNLRMAVAYDSANHNLYVTKPDFPGSYLYIIQDSTNTVIGTIPLPDGAPTDITYNPSNGNLYIANGLGSVLVIDTVKNMVSHNIFLPPSFPSIDGSWTVWPQYAISIAYDPDNENIYVADFYGNVDEISSSTNSLTAKIPLGVLEGIVGIAFNPTGHVLYVANASDRIVSIIIPSVIIDTVPYGAFEIQRLHLPSPLSLDTLSGLITYNSANRNMYIIGQSGNVSIICTNPPPPGAHC